MTSVSELSLDYVIGDVITSVQLPLSLQEQLLFWRKKHWRKEHWFKYYIWKTWMLSIRLFTLFCWQPFCFNVIFLRCSSVSKLSKVWYFVLHTELFKIRILKLVFAYNYFSFPFLGCWRGEMTSQYCVIKGIHLYITYHNYDITIGRNSEM